MPDAGIDSDYVAILSILEHRAHSGTGDISHDDLVDASRILITSVTGRELDDAAVDARLASLEAWGLVDKFAETEQPTGAFVWRRSYVRLRLTQDAELVLDALDGIREARQKPITTQDATNLLANIESRLKSIAERVQDPGRGVHADVLRSAYLDLQSTVARDLRDLKEFLHGLQRSIITFGTQAQFDVQELESILTNLESYVNGVLSEFQARSRRIGDACTRLLEPEMQEELNTGHHLARDADDSSIFSGTSRRPAPVELVSTLTQFFDPGSRTSLTAEVSRIRRSTRTILGRMRDHWQRIMERTSYVHQLARAWDRLGSARWDDDERWERVATWNSRLFDATRIATAPDLGDEKTPGRGLVPGRHYEYKGRTDTKVVATRPKATVQELKDQEKEVAARLNHLVMARILRGRGKARLSELDLAADSDFHDLLAVVKNSELLLDTAVAAEYFEFQARYVEAPRTKWELGQALYTAPEIEFTRRAKVQ